ncbi:AraC family transcriptional regulator [Chitinophaga agrisoli]|uniref:AraC family transcriptional regulator n=1 Tax=Chitinophaga agrisoli TaxID=2607653 RepID=A0A5B2VK79_9BACT|nr:helix-turn-helix domain-containing protein [Chitinophaga agrisoli]KAA2239078.1 AraC family transcriptional regulator [Chitinophaga agrisoli]
MIKGSATIDMLRDFPGITPILRESFTSTLVRVFNRETEDCRNYLSANRREFYKVLMITGGDGYFTMGLNKYFVDRPTIMFIHPNDIISWQKTAGESVGYYILFRKDFVNQQPALRAVMDRLGLFTDKSKSVITLDEGVVPGFNRLWESMYNEQHNTTQLGYDAIQAYMQLMMIDCARMSGIPEPVSTDEEYGHVHHFFQLLETKISKINCDEPLSMRTAKEFASSMALHPNYLNRVLKKYTGQNVSVHIKGRILDECKALLLQTNWTLEQVSYAVGFSDQPNFNYFFKKNTGLTPNEFRKNTV